MKSSKSKVAKGFAEVISVAKGSIDPRTGLAASDAEVISEGGLQKPYETDVLLLLLKINVYHRRCIRAKARMSCGLGYELQPKSAEVSDAIYRKEKKIFEEFELRHAERALQPYSETLVNLQTDYEIFGNGYLEVVRARNKKDVTELLHIPSRSCTLVREGTGVRKRIMLEQRVGDSSTRFKMFGDKEPVDRNEFLQLKDYNPESRYYGYPDYLTALATMLLDRGAVTYNAKRFSNDLMLQTILFIAGWKLDSDSRKKAKEFFKSEYKGLEAVSSALLLSSEDKEAKLQVETVGTEVKDASFRALRMDNREEVVDAHEVPRSIVGLSRQGALGDSNRLREELRIFRDITIRPRVEKMQFLHNFLLLPAMGIMNCKFVLNQIDLSDDKADADYYKILVDSGIIDADEARQPLGFAERTAKSFRKGVDVVKDLIGLREALRRANDLFGKER